MSDKDSIVTNLIENYKGECYKRYSSLEGAVFAHSDDEFRNPKCKEESNDSIFYHILIGKGRITVSASNIEYYYNVMPPPPPPPSMPDVISSGIENDSVCLENRGDTIALKSCTMELPECKGFIKQWTYRVKTSEYNIILYAVNTSDIDIIKKIVNPLKLIDISDYAQNFLAELHPYEVLGGMACVYDLDSVGNFALKEIRILE